MLQNLDIIEDHGPLYVLVLAGDHVDKMDHGPMLRQHALSRADVTVGCVAVRGDQAGQFGVLSTSADDRIESFVEKPADPVPCLDGSGQALASMGIYVFSFDYLCQALREDASDPLTHHDFGKN